MAFNTGASHFIDLAYDEPGGRKLGRGLLCRSARVALPHSAGQFWKAIQMSQRDSGYARIEQDNYETREWVTEALLPHIPEYVRHAWEQACGSGKMKATLHT